MKKLTAGIFTVLLGLVSVNAADAAVASKGYVLQEVGKVNTTIGTVAEGKTVVGLIEEAKTAASTGASEALDAYKATTNKAIADMDAAYKQADKDLDAAYKAADEAINQTIATNKQAADDGLALKEDKSNKADVILEADKDNTTKYTSVKAVYDAVQNMRVEITDENAVWQSDIDQSIQDLTAADTTINGRIDGVVTDYQKADADAKVAYEAADAALGAKIDGVESAYKQADTNIGTRIDDVVTAYQAADTALGNRVTTLETDNTQNKTDIATLQGDVAKLNGTGEGSVAKQIETVTEKINTVETEYKAADQDLTQSIASTQGEVDTLEGVVEQNKQEASAAAATAETNAKDYALAKANAAMNASVQYTDDVVEGLKLAEIARVPAACSNAANYCALTTNGTNFIWEVIERASGETIEGTPVTVPATVAATKPAALTK